VPLDVFVHIAIIEEISLCRIGLATVLRETPDLEPVKLIRDGSELESLAEDPELRVAIVGHATWPLDPLEIVRRLRAQCPECNILALMTYADTTYMAELFRAGATSCAAMSQDCDELIDAIKRTARGERYVPPGVVESEVNALLNAGSSWGLDRLTAREREVFDLLVAGHSNDEIAQQLAIGYRTVETHRRHIMQKLAARSIRDLFHRASRYGLLG
jgi:DNA-binding NarL/FixJ family response regulator